MPPADFTLKNLFDAIVEAKKSKQWLGFIDGYRTYLMTHEVLLVA